MNNQIRCITLSLFAMFGMNVQAWGECECPLDGPQVVVYEDNGEARPRFDDGDNCNDCEDCDDCCDFLDDCWDLEWKHECRYWIGGGQFTENEHDVAEQLLSHNWPTEEEKAFLYRVFESDPCDAKYLFNALSGSQYSQIMITTEFATSRFLRRLYDPLRPILAYYPSRVEEYPCGSFSSTPTYWVAVNGGKQFVSTDHRSFGFKASNFEAIAGAQLQLNPTLFLGAAAFYENTHTKFKLGGNGNGHTVLGGIYFASSHRNYYVFGDLVAGGTNTSVKRSFKLCHDRFSKRGDPSSCQAALYLEGGVNFNYHSYFLFQPFLGMEFGYYHFNRFHEKGNEFTQLSVKARAYGNVGSRLGVHFSTLPNPWGFYGFYLGLDLVWVCLWDNTQHFRHARFKGCGDNFKIHASDVSNNAFEIALNVTQQVGEFLSFYVTANAQGNQTSESYDVLGGIRLEW